jgi:hypothetical protein
MNDPTTDSQHDLGHFLKLAAAQIRHRMKTADPADNQQLRSLQLLEDLIKEQGQTNENSRSAAGPTR